MNKVIESTTVRVQPKNGNLLIKKVIKDYPVIAINNNKEPDSLGDVNYYVAGFSVSGYKLHEEVVVDINQFNNSARIQIPNNEQSYLKLQTAYKSLDREDFQKLVRDKLRITVIEYYIVHYGTILGVIVDPKDIVPTVKAKASKTPKS